MKKLINVFVIVLFFSCGAGTFKNDSKNWKRIFNESVPKEINLINSRFWKSPHWSYEYEAYLKFETSKRFMYDYFIKKYDLRRFKEGDELTFFEEKPEWFNTENIKDYNIWIHPDEFNHIKLLKHKKTGVIYFHSFQV